MLQAIVNRKAGQNFKSEDVHWHTLFNGSEDSLVSSVIGTLLYLPHDDFINILNKAFKQKVITNNEPIIDYEFWPNWNPEYTDNDRSVEPDVFIQTPKYHIIIEAKRANGARQEQDQWKRELIAYQNTFSRDKTNEVELIFIALGGVSVDKTELFKLQNLPEDYLPSDYIKDFHITEMQWVTLLNACLDYKKELDSIDSYNDFRLRILNDIIEYFAIHKIYSFRLFEDIKYPNNKISSYYASPFKLK